MGCFRCCFSGFRKSCGEFRARLRGGFIKGKVIPQVTNDVDASEKLQAQISHPILTSSSSKPEGSHDREESRTPVALNQMVEEFVEYEIRKIMALSQLENDMIAEEMMVRGATISEINEVARKERKDGMATVDIKISYPSKKIKAQLASLNKPALVDLASRPMLSQVEDLRDSKVGVDLKKECGIC